MFIVNIFEGVSKLKIRDKINEKRGIFQARKSSFKITKFIISINKNVHNKIKSL